MQTRLNTLVTKTGIKSSDSYTVLEIGPESGFLQKNGRNNFPTQNIMQLRQTNHYMMFFQSGGLSLNNNKLNEFNSFDFIIISMLGHVVDPKSFLEPYIKTLKENSILLEVPCMDWQHKLG